MRIGRGFGFVLLLTSGLCCAQIRSGGVVNPAGGAGLPGVTRSLGSVVNPAQGGLRVPGSRGGSAINNRGAAYAYPVFIGGYYSTPFISTPDDSQAPAAPAPSNVTVVMPPQQPVTPVVINYNYGSAPPSPGPDQTVNRPPAVEQDDNTPEPSHYLIAFKDHTIYAATAYWVDGDTLHYFTAGNVHNQASLALVDRDFTERLNKEAGLDVRLPASSK
jgi:hypothetical protein